MIAIIIKAKVCVICRSRRLRRITQTEALIIIAIMRKPNLIIVLLCILIFLAPVVQRLDNAIHRINHYPADSVVCFANTYPLDSDLSGG